MLSNLPIELIHKILIMRPIHPIAKLLVPEFANYKKILHT